MLVRVAEITEVISDYSSKVISLLGKNSLELGNESWSSALELINSNTFIWSLGRKSSMVNVSGSPRSSSGLAIDAHCTR